MKSLLLALAGSLALPASASMTDIDALALAAQVGDDQARVVPSAGQQPSRFAGDSTVPSRTGTVRIAGFAAELADGAELLGPAGWGSLDERRAWARLARARGIQRQRARWSYARSLVGQGRGGEAFGVLEVMGQDDPDLLMVDAYQLARGASLSLLRRHAEALASLSSHGLATNPEACVWRMRSLAESGLADQALAQLGCARPALVARRPDIRAPFAIAIARAANDIGKPDVALGWLRAQPDRDPAANLQRGRALGLKGQSGEARLRLTRASKSGNMIEQKEAQLGLIELALADKAISPADALKQLDALCYSWRGDHVEERALQLSYRLNSEAGNLNAVLQTGVTLYRFFDASRVDPELLAALQEQLTSALAPDSRVSVADAAGLYWEYRDLTPAGARGDYLVSQLAERLQAAGLYMRAAELLEHQLFARAGELAKGPLSARVATLFILAGRSDRAIQTLRRSDNRSLTDEMIHERKRVEAVALTRIGRVEEAIAVLEDVPDSAALRSEILWHKRDWQRLASETSRQLPSGPSLSDVDQAVLLRHAVSLAMLGREEELATLRGRYAAQFTGKATEPLFDLLTRAVSSLDSAALARAMAAIPSASPAGALADLIDASPAAGASKGG